MNRMKRWTMSATSKRLETRSPKKKKRCSPGGGAPRPTEAKIAVAWLVAPALLVVARQVLFYEVSMAFWGVVLGACALAVFGLGLVTLTAWLERRARQTSPLGGG